MKLKDRSLKSKEKFADGLMAVGNAIHSAVLISVLVFPLTAFISAIFVGNEVFSITVILKHWGWQNVGLFGIVYLVPIGIGRYSKEQAMNLYDEITSSLTTTANDTIP